MAKYIIKGINGFIGHAIAKRLLFDNNIVIGFGDETHDASELFPEYSNYYSFPPKCTNLKNGFFYNADAFLDLAWHGYGKFTNDFKTQFDNLNNIYLSLLFCKNFSCKKYIFFNSSAAYKKDIKTGEYTSMYGAAKKSAERIARIKCNQFGIQYNSILFSVIFGNGDFSKRSVNIIIKKMLNNDVINLTSADSLYDWVYIDDAVNGVISVVENGVNGIEYYVGNRQPTKFIDIVLKTKNVLNSNSYLNFGKYIDPTYIDYSAINMNQLYKDTGFECICNFEKSIKKTAEWVKSLEWEV